MNIFFDVNKWVILLFCVFISSCSTQRNSKKNSLNPYGSILFTLSPQFQIFHTSSDSSIIFAKLSSENLLPRIFQGKNILSISVSGKLYDRYDKNLLLDTFKQTFNWQFEGSPYRFLEINVPFKSSGPKNQVLELVINDIYKGKLNMFSLNVDRTKFNNQHVLPWGSAGELRYSGFVEPNSEVFIETYGVNSERLWVNYYTPIFDVAPPPFIPPERIVKFEWKVDSNYAVRPSGRINIHKPGIYSVSQLAKTQYAFLYNFGSGFPLIIKDEDLLTPLKYITTLEEYRIMKQSPNLREAIDDYWMKVAGQNKEKALLILKVYYSRVQGANKHFSSYKPGWMTDKGMIYTIFGPPLKVSRKKNTEIWEYKKSYLSAPITFTFGLEPNPFSESHYVLDRLYSYKDIWYIQVDNIRNGYIIN
ncbi:MAG: GWxTD domain-containing protein [Sphingobacteriales bacterium]